MNDLSKLFQEFNENISLTDNYKQKIRVGRDSIRSKINSYFENEAYKVPNHYTQGSYPMHTAILPLDGEDFDLDNGVYLQGYDVDQSTWPSVFEVHESIKESVNGHTKEVIDKSTCVRVVYRDDYHIDLPIYIMGIDEDGNTAAFLADKNRGWIISDPKAFREWFNNAVLESEDKKLRRIVKYFKQWSHLNEISLSGMAITILATECYSSVENDAVTLLTITTDIIDRLSDDFSCFKPVRPKKENLFESMNYYDKEHLFKDLNKFKDTLAEAIYESENQKVASLKLRDLFGEKRYPLGDENIINEDYYIKTDSPERIGRKNRHYA